MGQNETQEKQIMLTAVAYHLLKDAQSVHEQPLVTPGQLAPVYILGMAFHSK